MELCMEHNGDTRGVWPGLGGSWGPKLWVASLSEGAPYNNFWGDLGFIKERQRKQNEQRLRSLTARLIQRSLATLARAVLMELRGRRPDSIEKTHEWGVQKIETRFKKTVHAGSARDKWATTRGGFPASEFTRTQSSPTVKWSKKQRGGIGKMLEEKSSGCCWKEIHGVRSSYPFKLGSFKEGWESAEDADTFLSTTWLW